MLRVVHDVWRTPTSKRTGLRDNFATFLHTHVSRVTPKFFFFRGGMNHKLTWPSGEGGEDTSGAGSSFR